MQHNDVGFLLPDTRVIEDIYPMVTDLISKDFKNQYVCFTDTQQKSYNKIGIPILSITECKFFYGTLFVFDIESLLICKSFPNVKKIYYYMTDIPWKETPHINYFDLRNLYQENTNVNIITKTLSLYSTYSNCWNRQPLGIMEELNYENFKRLIFAPE
jgi:hypothetical protein